MKGPSCPGEKAYTQCLLQLSPRKKEYYAFPPPLYSNGVIPVLDLKKRLKDACSENPR